MSNPRTQTQSPSQAQPSGRAAASPGQQAGGRRPGSPSSHGREANRQLIVGREITLSGEIRECDHLVVEGRIEAKISDCQTIDIANDGVFKGSAEVDSATIAGRFEGELTVKGRLTVQGTGLIEGSVLYGELAVDAGGRLIGTLSPRETDAKPKTDDKSAAAKDSSQAQTTSGAATPPPGDTSGNAAAAEAAASPA